MSKFIERIMTQDIIGEDELRQLMNHREVEEIIDMGGSSAEYYGCVKYQVVLKNGEWFFIWVL